MMTLPAVDAYRRIATVYNDVVNPVTALERRVLASALPSVQGLRVLDVGAGTGYWATFCRVRGADAVAVDPCPEMLEQATGARIIGDARRLPLRDECVDLVICGMMLAYAPEAFSELVRVVRRGGTLFVTDLHPKAIARGWQRTFRVGAEVLQPAHSSYSIAELAHPSLQRLGLIEAAFGEPEAAVFERAGKQSEFASMAAGPAIFVGHWSKL